MQHGRMYVSHSGLNPDIMKESILFLCVLLASATHAQTTHELFVRNFEFDPPVIDAAQGDSLRIMPVDSGHTFNQVSEDTWLANGTIPDGLFQFNVLVEPITVELTGSGTIHYVCTPHAAAGMKGLVNVALASGIDDHALVSNSAFFPNPASNMVWMRDMPTEVVDVSIVDALGREAARMQVAGTEPIHVGDLPNGSYHLRVMDKAGVEVLRQQLVVAH